MVNVSSEKPGKRRQMMDFGKVFGRAWEITWRWKMLWVLGFLAALGQGSGGGPQANYSLTGDEFNQFDYRLGESAEQFFLALSGVILILICVFLIIAIALWVISVIARGGLIAGVLQVEEDGETSFGKAWSAGVRKFWTLFGLGILAAIPLILLLIIGGIILFSGIFVGIGLMDVGEAAGITTMVLVSIICGGFLCCGLFILVIILEQIRIYGERAAIIENLGWIDAFVRGWEVLKDNLGATIIFWLIFFALGIVILGISFVIVLAFAAPLFGLFLVSEPGLWLLGPICIGGLLGTIIYALIRSIIVAFTSATWTLAYREMTAPEHPDLDNLELIEGEAA
jgi:hypothetical protein